MHPNDRRPLAAFLAAVALTAALQAQTPIGFEETYALSADRAAAIATLIPGSPDWYYWHCRERLDARDFATVRRLLPQWVQRHGADARSNEIECREMLLSADGDRERTFAFLKDRLGLSFDHQPQIPGAVTMLPTRLDPQLVATTTLTQRALANHPGTVRGFTDLAIRGLGSANLDADQLHDLIGRLRFPDIDNLPALVVRDLGHRASGGFGSWPIHGALRLDQLEECARLRPELLRDGNFVNAWLTQAAPREPFWQNDPAARAQHLQRLWQFAQRLPPAFRSLQAQVLHHWLQHDLTQGGPDKQRFLAYLRLPRPSGHAPFRERRGEDAVAQLGQPFATALPPCGDDGELVRACLEHFFATEANADAYTEWLDADWVRGVLAETKLLLGDGDPQQWYGLLADPTRVERLKERIELRFAATTKPHFRAGDAVALQLDVKNVPTLLVKVYAIDAARYLQETGKEVDAGIPLDGVVANFEQTFTYSEAPLRRVRRTFELPQLAEPGTWVVEFVGNGVRSRAVVQKGQLRLAERSHAAGHLVRVFDEDGLPVTDATAWFGGRDYRADERGEILLPFSTSPGQKPVVLRRGRLASLAQFDHRAETFALECHAHVDREALVAGQTAKVLVRPRLRLDDRDVALAMLQDVVLTFVATDLDGRSTTVDVRNPAFVEEREFVHELAVAERLVSLDVSLRAKVKDLAGNDVALATAPIAFDWNGMDSGPATSAFQLLPTRTGYVLEARGKNGERRAGRVAQVQLRHRDYTDTVDVTLQTDADGRIALGALDGITTILVNDGRLAAEFAPARGAEAWPIAVHGIVGETLRLPWTGAMPTRRELSLLGRSDHFANVALRDGALELRDLPAGSFRLVDHATGRAVQVELVAGRRHGEWLADAHLVRSASREAPLVVGAAEVRGDRFVVRLGNARPGTRVHVIAGRAVPVFDAFAHLPIAGDTTTSFASPPTMVELVAGRALGDEYRYVLERRQATKFAGNMLARPSLLLNPWQLDASDTNAQWGAEGEGMSSGKDGRHGGRFRGEAQTKKQGEATTGSLANLDWMPHGSTVLANLVPNAAGVVDVPLADLGSGHFVQVLALDGDQAVRAVLVRDEQPVPPRARALPHALDTTKSLVEQKRIEFVAAGATTQLADARSAKVEIHDSLASVFRLFTTISNNQDLAQFAFVLDWPQKKPEEKAALYRQHACHELHFFLAKKDPQFFAAVVKPFLQQKLDKTFLDHWLLGSDLTPFTEPWAFAQLNLIERILLSQRLDEAGRTGVARTLREALELRPVDAQRLDLLFDHALDSTRLATAGLDLLSRGFNAAHYGQAPALDPAKKEATDRDAQKKGMLLAADEPAQDAKPEAARADAPAELAETLRETADAERGAEYRRRHEVERLYRAIAKTRLLVEHNWFHRTMQASTADVVAPNRFWADYATAPAGQPFVSSHLVEATTSCLEMMLALSVLDLPFTPGKHEVTANGDARTLKAGSPLLLVRKEVTPAERAADGAPLLLGQNFFRLDDRFETVGGERRDRFVTGEFVVDVPYGCQVVVTNPTSSNRTAEVLLQIPAGAVPLQSGFWTKGKTVQLGPYATATLEYAFYFPGAGSFAHYPAHAAEKGKLAANAEARTLAVVDKPTKVDTTSWEHVSQQGTPAEVLAFLDSHNVHGLDLSRIAWRMKDREFFTPCLQKLRTRHAYDATLWSYGLLHRDPASTREFLQHRDDFVGQCGMSLESTLLTIEPKERRQYQHLELDPLVHPRAHRFGGRRVLLNQDLARQYSQLLNLVGYHTPLSADDWLVVSYYLFLQDRIEDGLAAFAKVDRSRVQAQLQYDYLQAWSSFFTGELQKARTVAESHKDHPVLHWQQRFRDVLSQLDEAAGTSKPQTGGETTADPAATAPALELAIEGRSLVVQHKNLKDCEVRYYELDVEFAFSAQPFASESGTSAAFVMPNLAEQKQLGTGAVTTLPLPDRFAQKNVLVEVRAGGLVRSKQYFANALAVRFLESFGQVAVTAADTQAPLAKAYVKVFARLPNGTVRFHKDGYTDLRGRFDYASLSDDPNASANRYAVLVLDEQRGAVIREVAPPAK